MNCGVSKAYTLIKHDKSANYVNSKTVSGHADKRRVPPSLSIQQGVTLLEILIALAVIAIVLTVISPNVQTIVTKSKTSSTINELSSVIQHARFIAVDQNITTRVCPTNNFSSCTTNWNHAKMVFIDANGNGSRDTSEPLITTAQKVSTSATMTGPNSALSFQDSGAVSMSTSIKICPNNNDVNMARSININAQGRVRVSIDSNNDGMFEDTDGNNLTCS